MTNSVTRKTYGLHNHYLLIDVAWTESLMVCSCSSLKPPLPWGGISDGLQHAINILS